MIKIGSTNIKTVMLGTQPIKAVYKGASLIWQKITKVLKSVSGGTSATLTDVYDSQSLVLLQFQGSASGSGDKTDNIINPQDTICGNYNSGYYVVSGRTYINSYTDLGVNITTDAIYRAIATRVFTKDELNTLYVRFNQDSTSENSFGVGLQAYSSEDGTNASKVGTQVLKQWGSITKDQWYDLTTTLRSISTYQNNNYFRVYIFCRTIVTDLQCDFCTDKVPYGYKIGVLVQSSIFDYEFYFANKQTVVGSTNDRYEYQLKPNTTYRVSSNIPYQNGVTIVFAKSGQYTNTNTPTTANAGFGINDGTVVDRTVTTDANGYMYIAIRNQTGTYAILNGLLDKFRNGTYYIILREPLKTPIQLDTYIGATALTQGEKVSVNFENETATRGTTDIKALNTHLFDLEQTTFDGTTVIVDGSTNKVASMDVEYYASK